MDRTWVNTFPSCITLSSSPVPVKTPTFSRTPGTSNKLTYTLFYIIVLGAVVTLAYYTYYNFAAIWAYIRKRASLIFRTILCFAIGLELYLTSEDTASNYDDAETNNAKSDGSLQRNIPPPRTWSAHFPPFVPYLQKNMSNFPPPRTTSTAFLDNMNYTDIVTMMKQYRCLYRTVFGVEGVNVLQVMGPFLRRIIHNSTGPTMLLDIGSNTGQELQSILNLLTRRVKGKRRIVPPPNNVYVVSVEPNVEHRPELTRIAQLHSHTPTGWLIPTLCQAGVANEAVKTPTELFLVGKGVLANIVTKEELMKTAGTTRGAKRIHQLKITEIVERFKTQRLALVKIDTEGYDWTIMWSLMSLWAKFRPDLIVFEVNPFLDRFPSHPSPVHEAFQSIGYTLYLVGMYYDGEDRWKGKNGLADIWGEERLPLMFLLEMTKERWYASTPMFGFSEAGVALPDEGEILREFVSITSNSPEVDQQLIMHIMRTRKGSSCFALANVSVWRILVHRQWWENRTSSQEEIDKIMKKKQNV
eukprot:PhF_6_TR36189/c0_g1_i2/m.52748